MPERDQSSNVRSLEEAREAKRRDQRQRFIEAFLRLVVEAGNAIDVDEPLLTMPEPFGDPRDPEKKPPR